MSRFRFVSEFAPDYGVKRLCRVLERLAFGLLHLGPTPAIAAQPPRRRAGRV